MPNLLNVLIWFPIAVAILMLAFIKPERPTLAKLVSALSITGIVGVGPEYA